MPSRPDLRDLVTSVRDAFADADRDTLLDVLTFVVQEYVVDGPPPMLVHQVEQIADLASLSFAQLITALQTRLDAPELALFSVDGEQVSVRINGVQQPLQVARGGAPAAAAASPAAPAPRPAVGVQIVETTMQQRPAAPSAPATAPRPTQGLSLRGRPTGSEPAAAPQAPAAAAPAAPATPAAPAAPAAASVDKPKDGGDEASARFSLLELD